MEQKDNMIDDNVKQVALDLLPVILNTKELNSILTIDAENDEQFLIVEDWAELGTIQKELNKWCSHNKFYQWKDIYVKEQGREAFQRMRLGNKAPYLVPDGLFELDDIIEWGFADEYMTCYNCGKAIYTTPLYHGDKPRYAIVNDDCLCGDCIVEHAEDDYIKSVTNNPSNAINTAIISESRLAELGWKKLSKTYNAGIRERNNDNPTQVFNRYTNNIMSDLLFTYESGQFDLDFWLWVNTNQINTYRRRKHDKIQSR